MGRPRRRAWSTQSSPHWPHDVTYRLDHHADLTWRPQVEVVEVAPGQTFTAGGASVTVGRTDHRPVEPTVGYRVTQGGKSIVIAGDTIPCADLDQLCAGAEGGRDGAQSRGQSPDPDALRAAAADPAAGAVAGPGDADLWWHRGAGRRPDELRRSLRSLPVPDGVLVVDTGIGAPAPTRERQCSHCDESEHCNSPFRLLTERASHFRI